MTTASVPSSSFWTPHYHDHPRSKREVVQNYVESYFDWSTPSNIVMTALKVISYVTPIFLVMLVAKVVLRWMEPAQAGAAQRPTPHVQQQQPQQATPTLPATEPAIQAVLNRTPAFAGYRIGQGTAHPGTNLTAATVRPSNLFFHSLLGEGATTMPGSGQLFAFTGSHDAIRAQITQANPADVVSFTARGSSGGIRHRQALSYTVVPDLAALYGPATYRLSYGELQAMLQSQKIYTSPLLPLPFYAALKLAMQQDGIATLPGNDAEPMKVMHMTTPYCHALIANVRAHFATYGFTSLQECDTLLNLTLYQVGSLVVKSEDFYIFMDANGRIRERNPGAQDAVRLINACGIRGIHATPSSMNQEIMTQAFRTALVAAERDFVVFPAVGMGVWGGDPNLYWRAFLDAVVASGSNMEKIFVNPNHQVSPTGRYAGQRGGEFQLILDEYLVRERNAGNTAAIANLEKIVNLFASRTDVVHLSQELKVAFPSKVVSLFNASDPDVTLGNLVGEYVNNLDHPTTTEENYTALGSNGLCFETITGVHQDPSRVIGLRAF